MVLPASFERLINRPYYVYRPGQLLRRLRLALDASAAADTITFPWGLTLSFDPAEDLGRTLSKNGVSELVVTEALYRLPDPGELAVDVGANIGYMTSVLAAAVGPSGQVRAFEPHPELFKRLTSNANSWGNVIVAEAAASDRDGTCRLAIPEGFTANSGIARVQESPDEEGIEVRALRLDSEISSEIGVLKVDVEGHELRVLEGAQTLLKRSVRDIVFEDHDGYPSQVSEMLESCGYSIFGLEQHLRGPRAVPPASARPAPHGAPQNYLATAAPDRARQRINRRGWRTLSGDGLATRRPEGSRR